MTRNFYKLEQKFWVSELSFFCDKEEKTSRRRTGLVPEMFTQN